MLDYESVADEHEALRRLVVEFRPVVITDSLELVTRLKAQPGERAPFILYIADRDESSGREAGLNAGADECVARRASVRELDARLAAARRIAELETVLRITLAENRKLSATDDLTRVASRRFFSKHFPREMERAARYGRGLSLVLCDIDFFKKLNDTLGHAGGDQILRQFGARLQQNLRRGVDWVARIGGEEFAVVLPETSYEDGAGSRAQTAHGDCQDALHLRSQERTGHRELRTVRPRSRARRRAPARAADTQDRRRGALSQQARWPQPRHRDACSGARPSSHQGRSSRRVWRKRAHA